MFTQKTNSLNATEIKRIEGLNQTTTEFSMVFARYAQSFDEVFTEWLRDGKLEILKKKTSNRRRVKVKSSNCLIHIKRLRILLGCPDTSGFHTVTAEQWEVVQEISKEVLRRVKG